MATPTLDQISPRLRNAGFSGLITQNQHKGSGNGNGTATHLGLVFL